MDPVGYFLSNKDTGPDNVLIDTGPDNVLIDTDPDIGSPDGSEGYGHEFFKNTDQ